MSAERLAREPTSARVTRRLRPLPAPVVPLMFLHSWVLFPVVVFVLRGCGLLVDRIAGRPLPGALIAPVGMALLMVVSAFFTWPEPTAPPPPRSPSSAIAGLRRRPATARGRRRAAGATRSGPASPRCCPRG